MANPHRDPATIKVVDSQLTLQPGSEDDASTRQYTDDYKSSDHRMSDYKTGDHRMSDYKTGDHRMSDYKGSDEYQSEATITPTAPEFGLDLEPKHEPALCAIAETPDDPEAPLPDTHDLGPPPDGGFRAWMCVASASLVTLCLFGFVMSFGQLQEHYLEHQLAGYSKSTVAWMASIQATFVFALSVFVGRVFDAYGATPLVLSGSILSVVALVCIAFSHEYYQFFLSHALYGAASSFLWSPAAAVSGHWFTTRRSTAIGIIVSGSGIGGVVYPIMLKHLFDKMSFRNSVLCVAALNTGLLLPAWVFLKSRLPRRKPVPFHALRGPWKDKFYSFCVAGSAFMLLNWMSPYFDALYYVASNNVSPKVYDYSLAILQAGSFFGRAMAGYMGDKLGVWNVFGSVCAAMAVTMFAFWVPTGAGDAVTIIGMILYGWTSGAMITLIAAVVASISPPHEVGMRIGMLFTSMGIPILVGPVICGVLVQLDDGKFSFAAVFCGLSFAVGTVLLLVPHTVHFYHERRRKQAAKASSA